MPGPFIYPPTVQEATPEPGASPLPPPGQAAPQFSRRQWPNGKWYLVDQSGERITRDGLVVEVAPTDSTPPWPATEQSGQAPQPAVATPPPAAPSPPAGAPEAPAAGSTPPPAAAGTPDRPVARNRPGATIAPLNPALASSESFRVTDAQMAREGWERSAVSAVPTPLIGRPGTADVVTVEYTHPKTGGTYSYTYAENSDPDPTNKGADAFSLIKNNPGGAGKTPEQAELERAQAAYQAALTKGQDAKTELDDLKKAQRARNGLPIGQGGIGLQIDDEKAADYLNQVAHADASGNQGVAAVGTAQAAQANANNAARLTLIEQLKQAGVITNEAARIATNFVIEQAKLDQNNTNIAVQAGGELLRNDTAYNSQLVSQRNTLLHERNQGLSDDMKSAIAINDQIAPGSDAGGRLAVALMGLRRLQNKQDYQEVTHPTVPTALGEAANSHIRFPGMPSMEEIDQRTGAHLASLGLSPANFTGQVQVPFGSGFVQPNAPRPTGTPAGYTGMPPAAPSVAAPKPAVTVTTPSGPVVITPAGLQPQPPSAAAASTAASTAYTPPTTPQGRPTIGTLTGEPTGLVDPAYDAPIGPQLPATPGQYDAPIGPQMPDTVDPGQDLTSYYRGGPLSHIGDLQANPGLAASQQVVDQAGNLYQQPVYQPALRPLRPAWMDLYS